MCLLISPWYKECLCVCHFRNYHEAAVCPFSEEDGPCGASELLSSVDSVVQVYGSLTLRDHARGGLATLGCELLGEEGVPGP